MIATLVWRNIWRNRRRSLITMTSVAFAVLLAVTMKSLQDGVFTNLVRNVVGFYTGYIQVHKAGYADEQILDNSMESDTALFRRVAATDGITGMTERIETFALASTDSGTHGCMVVGTDVEAEDDLTGLSGKIIKGAYFKAKDRSVIIAEGLSKRLNAGAGDTLVLLGQGYHGNNAAGKYPVAAVARFASPQLNESLIYIPLEEARNFLSAPGMSTTLAINITATATPEETASSLRALLGNGYEVRTWRQIMPDIDNHIKADNIDFYIFIGILYLLIGFGIFGTVLMMLAERKYELGMLMAVGMKRAGIAAMLFWETILISLMGTLAGLALSYPVVLYLQKHPIVFSGESAEAYKKFGFDPVWPTIFDPGIFLTQSLIVLVTAVVISIFPLMKVKNLDPVTAMKK